MSTHGALRKHSLLFCERCMDYQTPCRFRLFGKKYVIIQETNQGNTMMNQTVACVHVRATVIHISQKMYPSCPVWIGITEIAAPAGAVSVAVAVDVQFSKALCSCPCSPLYCRCVWMWCLWHHHVCRSCMHGWRWIFTHCSCAHVCTSLWRNFLLMRAPYFSSMCRHFRMWHWCVWSDRCRRSTRQFKLNACWNLLALQLHSTWNACWWIVCATTICRLETLIWAGPD